MTTLAERLLTDRAVEYVRRYQPLLIAQVSSFDSYLFLQAVKVVLQRERLLRVATGNVPTPDAVAHALLGLTPTAHRRGIRRLLVGSKIRELVEKEPDTFLLPLFPVVPGQLDVLATLFAFHVAVVGHLATTQLDIFPDKKSIRHEVASLVVTLPKDGLAILNGDEAEIRELTAFARCPVLFFGTAADSTVQLVWIQAQPPHGLVGEVRIDKQRYELSLPHVTRVRHVYPVLAALAVAHYVGLPLSPALTRLRAFRVSPGYGRILNGIEGSQIIDESAEATPEDMLDSLAFLRELPGRRKIAIVGDVPALGALTVPWYERLGKAAANAAPVVILVGSEMQRAGPAAIRAGADVHHFDTSAEVAPWLGGFLHQGDVVLVKGAAHMDMKKIVERLTAPH